MNKLTLIDKLMLQLRKTKNSMLTFLNNVEESEPKLPLLKNQLIFKTIGLITSITIPIQDILCPNLQMLFLQVKNHQSNSTNKWGKDTKNKIMPYQLKLQKLPKVQTQLVQLLNNTNKQKNNKPKFSATLTKTKLPNSNRTSETIS